MFEEPLCITSLKWWSKNLETFLLLGKLTAAKVLVWFDKKIISLKIRKNI